MLICLIRGVAGNASAAQQQAPGTLFQTTELTIAAPLTSTFRFRTRMSIRTTHSACYAEWASASDALGPKGVSVNGRRQTRVFLDSDDTSNSAKRPSRSSARGANTPACCESRSVLVG